MPAAQPFGKADNRADQDLCNGSPSAPVRPIHLPPGFLLLRALPSTGCLCPGGAIRRPVPDQFSIAVVKACPNDCLHCSAPSRQGQILSSDVIKGAISQALDMGSYLVTFDGGEPMLRKDLPDLVSSVDQRAVATSFTSGYHLTLELARQLKEAGLYAVRISIDSPIEEQHDRFRGRKGAFQDALSGVRNALEAGLLVDLFMVTSPHNIDYLEDAFSLAAELGVQELSMRSWLWAAGHPTMRCLTRMWPGWRASTRRRTEWRGPGSPHCRIC